MTSLKARAQALLESTSESAQIRRACLEVCKRLHPVMWQAGIHPGHSATGWRLADENVQQKRWTYMQFDNGNNWSGNTVTFERPMPTKVVETPGDPIIGKARPQRATVINIRNDLKSDWEYLFKRAIEESSRRNRTTNDTLSWDVSSEVGVAGGIGPVDVSASVSVGVGGEHGRGSEVEMAITQIAEHEMPIMIGAGSLVQIQFSYDKVHLTQERMVTGVIDFGKIMIDCSEYFLQEGSKKYSNAKAKTGFYAKKWIAPEATIVTTGVGGIADVFLGQGRTDFYKGNPEPMCGHMAKSEKAIKALEELSGGAGRHLNYKRTEQYDNAQNVLISVTSPRP